MSSLPGFPSYDFIEVLGLDRSATQHLSVSTSGTSGVMGTPRELTASTLEDTDFMNIHFYATLNSTLFWVNVMVGAVGFEETICKEIRVDTGASYGEGGVTWHLPIRVPKGSRLSVEAAQRGSGSNSARMAIQLFSSSLGAQSPFTKIERLNGNSTILGDLIDCNAVTAGTLTGWKEFVASTPYDYDRLFISTSRNDAATAGTYRFYYDIAIGPLDKEEMLFEGQYYGQDNVKHTGENQLCIPTQIPSGSRISGRAQCSTQTATTVIDLIVYGLR